MTRTIGIYVFDGVEVLDFAGDTFEKTGGTVIWARPQWWMRYRFRRVKPGERLQNGGVFNP